MQHIQFLSHTLVKVLNRKDIKQINNHLQVQFGTVLDLELVYILNTKNNLYVTTRKIDQVMLDKLRISSLGLYIGEFQKGELRLSIEGSQLIGPNATKGVIDLSSEQMQQWLCGQDVNVTTQEKGYLIVKYNNDFLGSGRIKNNELLNYVPKTRRVKEIA